MVNLKTLNEMSIKMAIDYISNDLSKSYELIRKLYSNIQNDSFLLAKRQMEMMLFYLNVLKHYRVAMWIGKVNNHLYCLTTDEGEVYRTKINQKLVQSFDLSKGEVLYKAAKSCYELKQYGKAANYYKESSLLGNAKAAFEYGIMLSKGIGCVQDQFMGSFWLWQSSQMANSQAMVSLGNHYYQGIGVWHSKVRGLYWFALGALHHNPKAMFHIGLSLQREEVVAGNVVYGKVFMHVAKEIPYTNMTSFTYNKLKEILEITTKRLIEDEGAV